MCVQTFQNGKPVPFQYKGPQYVPASTSTIQPVPFEYKGPQYVPASTSTIQPVPFEYDPTQAATTTTSSSSSSSTSSNNGDKNYRTCNVCKGTGQIFKTSTVGSYGLAKKVKCPVCGQEHWSSTVHIHTRCTNCNGTGQVCKWFIIAADCHGMHVDSQNCKSSLVPLLPLKILPTI